MLIPTDEMSLFHCTNSILMLMAVNESNLINMNVGL